MVGRDYKWYALYVTRHHERKVNTRTSNMGVETLLPMREVVRKWSDRIKTIEEPMFPSYLFAKVSCLEYFDILDHPSVVKYISFGGNPAIIPESQINALKKVMACKINAEPSRSDYVHGDRVIMTEGPLKGIEGELISGERNNRFRLRMDQIGYSLIINISKDHLHKEVSQVEVTIPNQKCSYP